MKYVYVCVHMDLCMGCMNVSLHMYLWFIGGVCTYMFKPMHMVCVCEADLDV